MEKSELPQVLEEKPDIIKNEDLPLYQKAAEQTGYGVNITAQEGQPSVGILNKVTHRTSRPRIPQGYVEIVVTTPPGVKITGPFYDAVRNLEQPPK